jgi:hypothetical protein
MHSLGFAHYQDQAFNFYIPQNGGSLTELIESGGALTWKDADASTGESPQDGGPGRRIGHIGFHLCYEPDNANEKFEIEWIQADDGTGSMCIRIRV